MRILGRSDSGGTRGVGGSLDSAVAGLWTGWGTGISSFISGALPPNGPPPAHFLLTMGFPSLRADAISRCHF
jgi:hypothetical protein